MRTLLFISIAVAIIVVPAWAQDAPRTWTVSPDRSIQAVIDGAKPGDTVQVLPGEYVESVEIRTPDLTLKGLEYEGDRTTLTAKLNEEDEPLALAIAVRANDVTVEGFVIRGFDRGIDVWNARGIAVRDMTLEDLKSTGLHLHGGQETTLEYIRAGNITGGAIQLEDSVTTVVSGCELYASGAGLVVNASETVSISNCSIHHNWLGVVLHREVEYVKLTYSRIMGNNASRPPRIKDDYPDAISGVGVLLTGTSHVEIAHCTIAENGSMGIVVQSMDSRGYRHLPKDEERDGPPSEHTYTHHNVFFGNGEAPCDSYEERFNSVPPGDIYWDGLGERNQFQERTDLKTFPENLVVEQGGVHTNVIHFQ